MSETKKDYNPPGWVVVHFDRSVKLDLDRAKKFHDFRIRLCKYLGQDHETCNINNLWIEAVDLLLANEVTLLAKVEHLDENFNIISDPV